MDDVEVVLTAEDVAELNRDAIGRAAAVARLAGNALVAVGVLGSAAWLWTAIRTQQRVTSSVNFSLGGTPPEATVDLVDRVDLFAAVVGALVLAALAVGFGALLRLASDFIIARSGGSVTGFEVGDPLTTDEVEGG